ncbi:PLP-dependent aminotransferase family protein [Rhodobacteraceae bacterium]|nr:PLP-dependent aminotransferase family protein [Paracoccaceae bacterium]
MPIAIDRTRPEPLQKQLRQAMVSAIHDGRIQPGQQLPSSRVLAQGLGVGRNTVTAAYDELIARGYLQARARRGIFVAQKPVPPVKAIQGVSVDWARHLRLRPSRFEDIRKPLAWQAYPFPFINGQVDPALFPLPAWRACSRDMMGRAALDWWAADRAVEDDPMLIEEIRRQILPQRGIFARAEEILITLGAQEGLYLAARLLAGPDSRIGVERPGYPDAQFLVAMTGSTCVDLPVDNEGARVPDAACAREAGGLDLAVLTPGAQCPTMITMSAARRTRWLERAQKDDFLIVEDDYEGEVGFASARALKAQDAAGRVIYLGTLSKVLAPGVRMGFMVAPAAFVREARWLRRIMHRSAPLNNQRTTAIFLAEGHYQTLVRRLRSAHAERWHQVNAQLTRDLPGFLPPAPCHGGSSIWLELPDGMANTDLLQGALAQGVAFELGDAFTAPGNAGRFIRLGLSCIPTQSVGEGVRRLGQVATRL